MDFIKLKELTKKLGSLLVMEGDKPVLVVMPYDKFEKLESGEEIPVLKNGFDEPVANAIDYDESAVESLNREIAALKEEIRQKEEAELIENSDNQDLFADTVDLD